MDCSRESAYIANLDGKQPGDLDLIHVVFEEAGDYEVNLKAEFEVDSVALDTTFSVKVWIMFNLRLKSLQLKQTSLEEQTENQLLCMKGGLLIY